MSFKKVLTSALACAFLTACLSLPVGAVETTSNIDTQSNSIVARASESIRFNVSANKISVSRSTFSLEEDDTVTFDCTYSPKSADIDIGLVASDGTFYYASGSNGSISKTIRVSKRGSYSVAVRNNSSSSVTVTGIINY